MTYIYATGTAGQFLQETLDTNGSQTKYSFDSAGRLIEQFRPKNLNPNGSDYTNVYADGTASTTPTETWGYDALGQLRTATDALGRTTQYTGYDNLGRPTQSQRMLGAAVRDVSTISCDGFGRVAQTKALAGVAGKEMVTTYEYDLLDRQTKMIDPLLGETQPSEQRSDSDGDLRIRRTRPPHSTDSEQSCRHSPSDALRFPVTPGRRSLVQNT